MMNRILSGTGRCLAAVAATLAVMLTATVGYAVVVEVPATVEVQVRQVCLADIAVVKPADSATVAALKEVFLMAAPPPGGSRQISGEEVKLLAARCGFNVDGVEWLLPDEVEIRSAGQAIGRDRLQEACRQAVAAVMPADAEWQVEIGPLGEQYVPPGRVEVRAGLPRAVNYRGPTPVELTVSVNGQPVTTVKTTVKISGRRPAVVATVPIAANQPIGREMVAVRPVDLARLAGGFYTDPGAVVGKAVNRGVPADTVISDSLLVMPVVIKRGQVVMLNVHSGGVDISLPAEALQDGRTGQMIKVKNLTNNATVAARVIDANNVEAIVR
ncbi:MAG: flagellar basal body P-ring formation chaperone FlgA [Negativicutes bacterium]|nr:flagellar basal body P-ring formation chaperone FlgA [Negativicutes bacterium]